MVEDHRDGNELECGKEAMTFEASLDAVPVGWMLGSQKEVVVLMSHGCGSARHAPL
jgi:hypothetical protein